MGYNPLIGIDDAFSENFAMQRFQRTLLLLGAFAACAVAAQADPPREGKAPDAPRDKPVERSERGEPKNARGQLDLLLELQKEIDAAMKGGDPQKMLELVQKMQGVMQLDLRLNQQLRPRPVGERVAPKSELRQQYEKQLKEFAESIEKLKDDKEARAGIEKARDEYMKAMEAELKKSDLEKPRQPERPVGDAPAFPRRADLQPFPMFGFDRVVGVQPRLGVQLDKPSAPLIEQLDLPANVGLVLVDVIRGTPAETAGFKKNDILLQWAGKDLASDVEAFQTRIAEAKPGEKFEAVILRKGKKETIKGIELPAGKRADAGPIKQMQVQINGTVGEITASVGGVKYELTVEMEGRRPQPSKIAITDGEEVSKYDSVEKVPEKYRPTVDKLLGKIRGFE